MNYSANDGQNFGGKYLSLETSTQAPCLAVNGGNLSIAWKGKDNDNLSVAIVDLTGFSTPSYIFQTNIVNFTVKPGDTINCGVLYFGDIAGYVEMANQATGQHFSITLAPPPGATFDGDSIEWIMEAPDGGPPISSLPSFTPVNFTSAVGCGPNNAVGNPQSALPVNVVNTSNTFLTSVTLGSNSVTINFKG